MSDTRMPTAEERNAFEEDGYVFVRGLFSPSETKAINDVVETDPVIRASVIDREGREGGSTEIALWRSIDDDIFGAVARSARILDRVDGFLGGHSDFYHSKLTLKKPRVGGAWDWHQDYGYWYREGHLAPDMMSVMIALDRTTPENGCLKVLKGSHHLGRIEHSLHGQQVGADQRYVDAATARFEEVQCIMEPGDALFFHANLLHASGRNESDRSRNVMLCCYNRADNPSFMPSAQNRNVPAERLPDAGFAAVAARPLARERAFMTAESSGLGQ